MRRLLDLFQTTYPELRERKVLIIDDEADLASISGRRVNGVSTAGVISRQIDQLRELVTNSSFLQVTATPYSLYLQPEEEIVAGGISLFKPKRPAFTVLLPSHGKYVGGDEYFREKPPTPIPLRSSSLPKLPLAERDALKKEDRRRFDIGRY